jgi:hypothetical protein
MKSRIDQFSNLLEYACFDDVTVVVMTQVCFQSGGFFVMNDQGPLCFRSTKIGALVEPNWSCISLFHASTTRLVPRLCVKRSSHLFDV